MKTTYFLLLIFFGTFCFAQKKFQPKNSTIIETVEGDLDGDKILEKVIVYDITSENLREIQILKKINNKWTILEKSRNAILGNEDGGMMGDPFLSCRINKGILIIEHYGGSSWKWGFVDKYRFQNGHFELIGHSSEGGRPGDFWSTTDFNLSTGKIVYKKEVENSSIPENGKSENETFIKKGIKINLQNKNTSDSKFRFKLPNTKKKIYL
jgi:hypothetical protein